MPCKALGDNISTMHNATQIFRLWKSLLKILIIAQSAHNTCRYIPSATIAKKATINANANGLDITFMQLKTEHYSIPSTHFPKYQLLSQA